MISTQFALKTMVILLAVPVVAQSDLNLDLKPLKNIVMEKTMEGSVDAEQLRMAAETLAISAEMNAKAHANFTSQPQKVMTEDEKFLQMLENVKQLSRQPTL